MRDLNCSIAELNVHPVKSCAALAVPEALLIETGLDLDREWMLVDRDGEMLSQREHPRLALVQPSLRHEDLMLRAPGMLALHVSLHAVEGPTRVRLWDDEVKAYDMGDLAAQWFSDFLGEPGLRLVRFDPEQQRLSDAKWTVGASAPNTFSDGFPLLLSSTASLGELNRRLREAGQPAVDMRRFRANVVLDGLQAPHQEDQIQTLHIQTAQGEVVLRPVKPCVRCTIPDVDPDTAQTSRNITQALSDYRRDPRVGGGLSFGMNAVVIAGVDCSIRVGDRAAARLQG